MSVIGADGRGRVWEQVIVKHAFPKKLVKKPGGVCRAQGASEPGMLDGDIHTDNRQLGLTCCGGCSRSSQSPAGEGEELRRAVSRSLRGECLQRAFCSPATNSFYTREPKREALATIPLEWHYLMVVWSLSAESGLRKRWQWMAVAGPVGGGCL